MDWDLKISLKNYLINNAGQIQIHNDVDGSEKFLVFFPYFLSRECAKRNERVVDCK